VVGLVKIASVGVATLSHLLAMSLQSSIWKRDRQSWSIVYSTGTSIQFSKEVLMVSLGANGKKLSPISALLSRVKCEVPASSFTGSLTDDWLLPLPDNNPPRASDVPRSFLIMEGRPVFTSMASCISTFMWHSDHWGGTAIVSFADSDDCLGLNV